MTAHQNAPAPSPTILARLLRHDVVDYLQSVYSTVTLLLERLPHEYADERRLVSELKVRGEVCRYELDTILDLLSPPSVNSGRVDLVPLLSSAATAARLKYPTHRVSEALPQSAVVLAEQRALGNALPMLVQALAQSAEKEVRVEVTGSPGTIGVLLARDGIANADEHLSWLHRPFTTTHQSLFGLSLALTARALRVVGGEAEVVCPPGGGVVVRLWGPAAGPMHESVPS